MKIINKDFILKNYYSYFTNEDIIFICKYSYLNSKNHLPVLQENSKNYFVKNSIKNKLLNKLFNNSIFYKFKVLFSSNLGIIYSKKLNSYKNILFLLKNNFIYGLKFEGKIYLINQFSNLKSVNYLTNLKLLTVNLNSVSKILTRVLKSKFYEESRI